MSKERLFLDMHVIQTLPPSNINRDDSGSPKTAQYGGVRRARVSSQAWKRAMRNYFEQFGEEELGIRTKHIVSYVAEQIRIADDSISQDQALALSEKAIEGAGVKIDKKQKVAKALFFLGKKQAADLARAAIDNRDKLNDKKVHDELHRILTENPEIDIALFGRMVADDQTLNEDASAQVAHALSTHAVQTEYDYYTAIDDQSSADQTGAGMIGTIEYNSSTLYRYANIAVHELLLQLGEKDAVIHAAKLFVEAFSNSLPSGKVNSFANQTVPQAMIINVRKDRPVSLAGAYEKPVKTAGGYAEESVNRLFSELENSGKFVQKPLATFFISQYKHPEYTQGKEEDHLQALLEDLGDCLQSLL